MGDIFSEFVDHLGLVPKGGQSRVIGVFLAGIEGVFEHKFSAGATDWRGD